MLAIYIPTLRRVGVQPAYDALARVAEPMLVCPPDEVGQHKAAGYRALACPAQGIGSVRQWILRDAAGRGQDRMFMCDDDLVFRARRLDQPTRFRHTDDRDLSIMLTRLNTMLDQVVIAGVPQRPYANLLPYPVTGRGTIQGAAAVRVDIAHEQGWRYDAFTVCEDYDFLLQAVLSGHWHARLTTHVHENRPQSSGGCSTYRTVEFQRAQTLAFCERWPLYAKPRTTTSFVKQTGELSLNPSISLMNAIRDGQANRAMLSLPAIPEPDWTELAPEWG